MEKPKEKEAPRRKLTHEELMSFRYEIAQSVSEFLLTERGLQLLRRMFIEPKWINEVADALCVNNSAIAKPMRELINRGLLEPSAAPGPKTTNIRYGGRRYVACDAASGKETTDA